MNNHTPVNDSSCPSPGALPACPQYPSCSAPICPCDAASIQYGVWYVGEEVCTRRGPKPGWVGIQRRIAKRARDRTTCYSVAMLDAIGAVTRATCGLDPDLDDWAAAEAAWCAKRRRAQSKPPTDAQLRARSDFALRRQKAELATGQETSEARDDTMVISPSQSPEDPNGVTLKPDSFVPV